MYDKYIIKFKNHEFSYGDKRFFVDKVTPDKYDKFDMVFKSWKSKFDMFVGKVSERIGANGSLVEGNLSCVICLLHFLCHVCVCAICVVCNNHPLSIICDLYSTTATANCLLIWFVLEQELHQKTKRDL